MATEQKTDTSGEREARRRVVIAGVPIAARLRDLRVHHSTLMERDGCLQRRDFVSSHTPGQLSGGIKNTSLRSPAL